MLSISIKQALSKQIQTQMWYIWGYPDILSITWNAKSIWEMQW